LKERISKIVGSTEVGAHGSSPVYENRTRDILYVSSSMWFLMTKEFSCHPNVLGVDLLLSRQTGRWVVATPKLLAA